MTLTENITTAIKSTVLDNAGLIASAAGIRVPDGTPREEILAELLVLALFRTEPVQNPAIPFARQSRHGDLNMLSEDEFKAVSDKTELTSSFWKDKERTDMAEVIRNAILGFDRDRYAETAVTDIDAVVGAAVDRAARTDGKTAG